MSDWTSEEECKRLRACFDQVLGAETIAEHYRNRHAEGALCCIRAIQCDPRELLDALEEAETRRDDVLAEKRAVEVVAQHFGWDGTAARGLGYDAEDGGGDGALPDWFARICRERDEARAALGHVESLGFHVAGCYAHIEGEPDNVKPRCAPECPTATAQRALGDGKAQP